MSPISCRMIRSARHSVAWAAVFKHLGLKDFRAEGCRCGNPSPRKERVDELIQDHSFSRDALAFSPSVSRHWFRHALVLYAPGGPHPLPFSLWLAFPTFVGVNCYHIGMGWSK